MTKFIHVKSKIVSLLLLSLVLSSIKAQKFEWANILNGNIYGSRLDDGIYFNYIQPMHGIDELGNSYLAGTFRDSTYFQDQLLTTKGGADVFVQKFNSMGDVLWTSVLSNSKIGAFSINKKGEALIVGEFTDSLNLYQNNIKYSLSDSSLGNGFLLKLDSNGQVILTKQYSGCSFDQAFLADNGDILLTGPEFVSPFIYGTDTILSNSYGIDFIIVKINSLGNFEWAKQLGNNSEPTNRITSIYLDSSGNSFYTGYFGYRMDFDPGPGVFILGHDPRFPYQKHCFVLKLDEQGSFSWAKQIAAPPAPNPGSPQGYRTEAKASGYNIDLDKQGSIYISGYFNDSVDFNPGIGTYFFPRRYSYFILKLDSAGDFNWVYSPNKAVEIRNMEVSPAGSIYSTGSFSGEVDFDPSTSVHNLKAKGSKDIFIQKLSTDGKLEWARSLTGNGSDVGLNIKANELEDVFISGQFSDTIDLNPSQLVNNFHPMIGTGKYFFNLKLSNCIPDSSADIISSCSSYKWLDGNVYDSSNNTSFIRLMNSSGCDSIVSLDLTITSINTTTSLSDSSIISNDTLSSYRWLDCNDGFSYIPAESAMEFIYSDTGRYAVELTKSGCIDTSNCVLISTTGIFKNGSSEGIILYPNPTSKIVNFEISQPFSEGIITVKDVSGREISKIEFNSQSIPSLNLMGNKGFYFIELNLDNQITRSFKIIKL